MRLLYTLIGWLLTPWLRLWLGRRQRRGKEHATRLAERFGHASQPRPTGTLVWLHAASVGEAQSVLTLARQLLARHPALSLLITTGTVTSAAMLAQAALPRSIHQFVPVDTAPAVRRFLRHWQPNLALWVESEFWPMLLWQTRARGVPLLLINARISARSLVRWQRFPRLIRSLLGCFTTLYAGTADDAQRLIALGATNVREVGNLKFDAEPLPVEEAALGAWRAACAHRPVLLAASTHANEEQMLAEVQHIASQQFPDLLTVIVPRHATRGDAIAMDLRARGAILVQRSKGEMLQPDTDIYLADTMGELGLFYRHATLVLMGGSLVAHGGQNPLEPARLGNCLLSGPHTHNFRSIMAMLETAGAVRVVADTSSLAAAVVQLLADADTRTRMAQAAAQCVAQQGGASAAILAEIETHLARGAA